MKFSFILLLFLIACTKSNNQNEFCNKEESSTNQNDCIETESSIEYILSNDPNQKIELFNLSTNNNVSTNLKWYFHAIPTISRKTSKYQSNLIKTNSNGFYIQLECR